MEFYFKGVEAMKKFIAAVMAFCIVGGSLPAVYSSAPECAVTAFAADYEEITDGYLKYRVYEDYAAVGISDQTVEDEIVIPSEVNGVPVTEILPYAFYGCLNLKSIIIPDSVTSIDEYAFGWSGIESITIPDSVEVIWNEAFWCCTSLKSITLPDSIECICSFTFADCTYLKSVIIPDSVTRIENDAFINCESLRSITMPKSVAQIDMYAFDECSNLELTILNPECRLYSDYPIGDGCVLRGHKGSTAEEYAKKFGWNFKEISDVVTDGFLTYDVYDDHAEVVRCDESATGEVVISDKINGVPVTLIGANAFEDCKTLNSIVIPNSVNEIGNSAFWYCSGLESVILPENITSIGSSTFIECHNLKSINIPDSVVNIGSSAFGGCKSLESITIPDSVTIISSGAFSGCSGLKSLTIPSSVMSIEYRAFQGCTNLKTLTILNPECEIDLYAVILLDVTGTTIRGYKNSTAQAYASYNAHKFEPIEEICTAIPIQIVPGDANGDGGIDMSDVVMVMQAYLNPKKYGVNGTSPDRITADGEKAGDVDGKAGLTANDALVIQRFSLKLIDSFDEPAANS